MPANDHVRSDRNSKIEQDADRYVCGLITEATWRDLWGHLNPFAYTTVPVYLMHKRRYHADETMSQLTGSTVVFRFAP